MLKSSYADDYNYVYVLLSLLVAVPPVTEKLTTTSKGREAPEGTMSTIMGRIISTSASSTIFPGRGCKNIKEIAATIVCECRKQIVLKVFGQVVMGGKFAVYACALLNLDLCCSCHWHRITINLQQHSWSQHHVELGVSGKVGQRGKATLIVLTLSISLDNVQCRNFP